MNLLKANQEAVDAANRREAEQDGIAGREITVTLVAPKAPA